MSSVFKIKNKKLDFITGNSSRFLVSRQLIESKGLPEIKNYIELEYIESTGTQYINTLQKPTSNCTFELKTYYTSDEGAQQNGLNFGTISDDDNCIIMSLQGGTFGVYCGYNPYQIFLVSGQKLKNVDFSVSFKNGNATATINGQTGSVGVCTSSNNFYIFARNENGIPALHCKERIYEFKFIDNDVLTCHLIPVKDKNNVVCMYDKVSRTFFYNQGSGEFVAGPEI